MGDFEIALSQKEGRVDTSGVSVGSLTGWQRTVRVLGPCVLKRSLPLAFVWWILVEGNRASWYIGAPAVLLSATASAALLSPVSFRWYELVRFVPYFLIRSLLGGVDVAWRALHPGMPIDPHLVKYPIKLPPGLPRAFLANSVSLLPGTLTARIGSKSLDVHVLSRRKGIMSELERLEQRVGALFGTTLPDRRRPGPR